jgi:plasmid stabilization system protein ParE
VDGKTRERRVGGAAEAVATVVYSARGLADIERALVFQRDTHPQIAENAVVAIQAAVEGLAAHPFIGRRIEGELRELIVSYGHTGFVAMYRCHLQLDEVRVLALRHQREVGYVP